MLDIPLAALNNMTPVKFQDEYMIKMSKCSELSFDIHKLKKSLDGLVSNNIDNDALLVTAINALTVHIKEKQLKYDALCKEITDMTNQYDTTIGPYKSKILEQVKMSLQDLLVLERTRILDAIPEHDKKLVVGRDIALECIWLLKKYVDCVVA